MNLKKKKTKTIFKPLNKGLRLETAKKNLPSNIRVALRDDNECGRCGTKAANIYAEDLKYGGVICSRCTFLDFADPEGEKHPDCPPLPSDCYHSTRAAEILYRSRNEDVVESEDPPADHLIQRNRLKSYRQDNDNMRPLKTESFRMADFATTAESPSIDEIIEINREKSQRWHSSSRPENLSETREVGQIDDAVDTVAVDSENLPADGLVKKNQGNDQMHPKSFRRNFVDTTEAPSIDKIIEINQERSQRWYNSSRPENPLEVREVGQIDDRLKNEYEYSSRPIKSTRILNRSKKNVSGVFNWLKKKKRNADDSHFTGTKNVSSCMSKRSLQTQLKEQESSRSDINNNLFGMSDDPSINMDFQINRLKGLPLNKNDLQISRIENDFANAPVNIFEVEQFPEVARTKDGCADAPDSFSKDSPCTIVDGNQNNNDDLQPSRVEDGFANAPVNIFEVKQVPEVNGKRSQNERSIDSANFKPSRIQDYCADARDSLSKDGLGTVIDGRQNKKGSDMSVMSDLTEYGPNLCRKNPLRNKLKSHNHNQHAKNKGESTQPLDNLPEEHWAVHNDGQKNEQEYRSSECRSGISTGDFTDALQNPSEVDLLVRVIARSAIIKSTEERDLGSKNNPEFAENNEIIVMKNEKNPSYIDQGIVDEGFASASEISTKVGQIVRITELKGQRKFNGKYAMTTSDVIKSGIARGRIKIMPHIGEDFLALKPGNIQHLFDPDKKDEIFKRKIHKVAMFWPSQSDSVPRFISDIPVNALHNWPRRNDEISKYLKDKHDFIQPEPHISCIRNFVFYFDAANKTSPINDIAACIAKHDQLKGPSRTSARKYGSYHGPCILVYDPIKSYTNFNISQEEMWSLEELQSVLYFHKTGQN